MVKGSFTAQTRAILKGRNFDLYMINVDGTGNERVTYADTFDGFPMFSLHDGGKKFVFCSNRFNAKQGETNVFICHGHRIKQCQMSKSKCQMLFYLKSFFSLSLDYMD